jgi:hypothetical protein
MFRFFQNTKRSLNSLLDLIIDLVADGLLFFRLLFRSRTSPSVEVLFLRKQLAFYEERQVQPRRLNDSVRFSLILWSRLCNWKEVWIPKTPSDSENTEVPIIREIMVATTMSSLFVAFFTLLASTFRTRAALQAEILALRHQLAVFQKNAPRRLRLHRCDRLLWVVLYRCWSGWRRCLEMVQPDTVLRWHRRAFAWQWTRKSRRLPGRPQVAVNLRDLIQRMSQANPLWGAPRIHGELLKLGIAVAQSTVARYLSRPRKPPSQTWRTFLTNHLVQTAAIDFFTVPTATFRVLFVFVVLSHGRRRVVHFGVTEHPTQEWTMQQMREAFPWDEAPRYVLRDRDAIYGRDFAAMTRDMGMEEVLTAPRCPWQKDYASHTAPPQYVAQRPRQQAFFGIA